MVLRLLQLSVTLKTISPEKGQYALKLDELKQVEFVTLPRPYPSFLPYFYKNPSPEPFSIGNIESLQISIGPGISSEELEKSHGVALESIKLE